MVKELANWGKERAQQTPSETVDIMKPIAASMSHEQIKAVAAYLSTLR